MAQSQGNSTTRISAVIAVVLVLALALWLVVRAVRGPGDLADGDTNSSTPTVSAWDETSTADPSAPSTDPKDDRGVPVECPSHHGQTKRNPGERGGRYSGGGLSYESIPGWEARQGWGVDWASDRDGQWDRVTDSWVSIAIVGEIDREKFPSPQSATHQLMSCLASSYYYRDMTERKDLSSQAVTIDGKGGWKLVSEIHADHPGVQGDVIQIVVVDIGRQGKLSIFVSEAPIGDTERIAKTEAAADSLRVEG